jgi:polyhydroxyalkanoate synthesis regulator phasin
LWPTPENKPVLCAIRGRKYLAASDSKKKRREVMVKKQPVVEKKQPVKGKRKSAKKEKPLIIDVIEQAMSASVGLALKTRDEVKKFADDFIKKAELSEKEGKKFIDDLLKRYNKSREKLEDKVEKTVKDIVSRSSLVTKDELEEIKAELKKLKETSAE